MLPNATRVNRGGQVVAELVASARAHDFSDVLVLHEHRGQPDGLVVCHLPYGPTAYFGVHNAVCGGGRGAGGGWGQGLQGLAARAGGRGRARGGTARAPTHTPTSHTPPRAHPRPPTHSPPPPPGPAARPGGQKAGGHAVRSVPAPRAGQLYVRPRRARGHHPEAPVPAPQAGRQAGRHVCQPGRLHLVQAPHACRAARPRVGDAHRGGAPV